MVSHSLCYRKDTQRAKSIRKMAIMRGGMEVVFGRNQNQKEEME
nr:MAG TPA: hypothetical protein [Caudoviricetes sp.]